MTINIDNIAVIDDVLSPSDQFASEIDISNWLASDTISAVTYSVTDGNGDDATNSVTDTTKHTNTQTVIKPYIDCTKGPAVNDMRYTIKCAVTTSGGDAKAFYLKFRVKEYA